MKTVSFLALMLLLLGGCAAAELAPDTPQALPTETPATTPVPTQQPVTQESASQTPARSRGTLAPGDYTIEVAHDRRDRSYIVHVPPGVDQPAPVMIGLHGGGGTGKGFQDQNGFDAIADREGFIVVYPEGTGVLPNLLHTWNSGTTCCGFALDRDIDDVGFLRAVITDLKNRADVDSARIYMTGHSNGAMMAYRFAAEESELVTAIVPVGGAIDLADPQPTTPVAMLHIHSLDDPRAIYEGGEGPPFPGTDRTVNHEPVRAGIDAWATATGCAATPVQLDERAGAGENAGHTMMLLGWPGCDDGVAVQHLILTGTGHGWPGVENRPRLQRHLGPPTTIIDASEEVWSFVSQFERES